MVIDTLYINKFNVVKTISIICNIIVHFSTINVILIIDFSLIIKL